MASRKLIVEIVGDASSLQRSFRSSSAGAARFGSASKQAERDFSRASRGILSGSGVFRSLGRSLAFASGGFLAFGSAAAFLRSSVDAAREAAVTQRQLSTQLKVTGKSFADVKAQVDESTQSLSALSGFNATELTQSLTTILRGTKDLSRAEKLNALAADIARGRHISLAQAAIAVGKAAAGSTTSLRRLGIQLPKGATGAEMIAAAMKRFAGQAQAGSTVAERFGAVLHNSEVIVGEALLPTLNKYLISGGRWLQQMNETGRLQSDVNGVLHTTHAVIAGATAVARPYANALKGLNRILGGTTHSAELLTAAFVALKVRGMLGISGVAVAARAGIGSVGRSADVAGAQVAALRLRLLALNSIVIAPIVIPVVVDWLRSNDKSIQSFFEKNFPIGKEPQITTFKQFEALPESFQKQIEAKIKAKGLTLARVFPGAPGGPAGPASRTGRGDFPSTGSDAAVRSVKRATTLLGKFNLLELQLANAQLQQNDVLQRSILVSEEAILIQLRDHAKTLKDRTKYAQQAASVEDQIVSMDKTASDATKEAAKKAADARKRAAEAARQAAATYTTPLKLQLELVHAQALNKPVAAILRKIIATAKQALASGKKSAQGQIDAWQTIIDANNQLANQAANALGKFKQASTAALVAGLHLSREDERRLRARLSQLGPGGTVPGGGVGAFGMPFNQQGDLIVNVTLDGKKVEKSVTKHQQKRRRRDSGQRRGPFAGGYGY